MEKTSAVAGKRAAATDRSGPVMIGLVALVALLFWMSLYFYAPTLPVYVRSKSDSLTMVGVILAQYGLWQAVIRLPLGIAADWVGRRKPFIIAGLVLAALGAWTMGTADTPQGLLIGRAISGFAASTWVPLIVLFSSLFPPREAVRATSILTIVTNVGRMTSTSATGSLNALGGYSLAFFLSAITAGVGTLLLLPVREQARPQHRPSFVGVRNLITRRDVLVPALLAAVLQYIVWAVSFGFIVILADQLGATGVAQSMLMTSHIGLAVVGSLAAATLVDRFGARRLVYLTLGLMAAGIAAIAVASSLAIVFAAQFLMGLAQGVGYPVLMGLSIRDVDDAQRTTAMGLHQSVYAIGMFMGPWLSGLMADEIGIRPMLAVTAPACLIAGILLLRLLPSRLETRETRA